MAKLIIDNITYEVPDGQLIDEACQTAGQIDILEGAENINELNKEEIELAMDRNHRLGCQCKIISGTVKVTY
jgi:hypothetical protein